MVCIYLHRDWLKETNENARASSFANAFQNDRRNNHNDKISMKNMLMK